MHSPSRVYYDFYGNNKMNIFDSISVATTRICDELSPSAQSPSLITTATSTASATRLRNSDAAVGRGLFARLQQQSIQARLAVLTFAAAATIKIKKSKQLL